MTSTYYVIIEGRLPGAVTRGHDPAYIQVGDSLAYASVAGLLLLTGRAIHLRQRLRQQAP